MWDQTIEIVLGGDGLAHAREPGDDPHRGRTSSRVRDQPHKRAAPLDILRLNDGLAFWQMILGKRVGRHGFSRFLCSSSRAAMRSRKSPRIFWVGGLDEARPCRLGFEGGGTCCAGASGDGVSCVDWSLCKAAISWSAKSAASRAFLMPRWRCSFCSRFAVPMSFWVMVCASVALAVHIH